MSKRSTRRSAPGRSGADGGLDVNYECGGCGAEISSISGGPGEEACPICGEPRPQRDALDRLDAAVRDFRRSHRRLAEALQGAADQRTVDVARCLDLPVATARRWVRQGPPDPLKASR